LLNTVFGTLSAGVAASTNSYESISTVTVGSGGSASISFTSIPSTYTHLQIRGIARTSASIASGDFLSLTFNSDTGTNYAYHQLIGNGTAASAIAGASTNATYVQRFGTATQSANVFGATNIDILDYANTNKYKTMRFLGGYDNNGDGWIVFGSGLWQSTTAITGITLTGGSGNFVQYSQFALYGIKGS
jgi:hypothetical protein